MPAKSKRPVTKRTIHKLDVSKISPLRVGNNVIIRTVTIYEIGKIESITKDEIVLSSASWVAYTGRLHNILKSGFDSNSEIEPYDGPASVSRGAIVSVLNWNHLLPVDQK